MKITKEVLKRIIKEELEAFLGEEQLNEKLMLKKGKNGWWKFSQLVAEAYRAAPMMDDAAVEGYKVLEEWLHKHFGRIRGIRFG